MGGYHDEIHFNQGHHTGGAHPYRDPVAQVCGQTCEFCNGCDNLGGGMVDSYFQPYINGEKEIAELNAAYHSGLVR